MLHFAMSWTTFDLKRTAGEPLMLFYHTIHMTLDDLLRLESDIGQVKTEHLSLAMSV